MEKQIFQAKDYSTRSDLEAHINSLLGQNPKDNRGVGHEIKGTQKQLKALSLSDRRNIWGVKVVCTNRPTSKLLAEKVKKPKPKR